MSDKIIKITCSIENIRFYKDERGIIEASVDRIEQGEVETNKNGNIVLLGSMPTPVIGQQYVVKAEYKPDSQWGPQYEIITMINALSLNIRDREGQKKFLLSIFTPLQVEEMYKGIDDPFTALKEKDYQKLVQIKGCGLHRAESWASRFNDHLGAAKIYIELEDFNLTNTMINKLLDTYKSPDIVIEKVKENPFTLMEVDGIGWSTANRIALEGGMNPYGEERTKAFILYYLEDCALKGYSWITPDELLGAILDNLGEEVEDAIITKSIRDLREEKRLYCNDDKTKMGLCKYYNLELKIATELLRLLKAPNEFVYGNWKENLKQMEDLQGWSYTQEQVDGVKTVLENNVCIVYGLGGVGKTTVVKIMLEALKKYTFAQCALAGRAGARMAEVTGEEGYTIHRLLGFPCKTSEAKNNFLFHDENPLPHDIIILDEISMVDAKLFYSLVRAIRSGSKLIMLGDDGQLESIGCGNIAHDLISSGIIPQVHLTQIHRQAASSAIITESRKIRYGQQIINKDWTGTETRGNLQDLTVTCYSDRSNTFYEIMKRFAKIMQSDNNIMNTQILVPVKDRGQACTWTINNAIQELYNPKGKNISEVTVNYGKKTGILRLGDKVINTKNNYQLSQPIFNGSMGVITEIDPEGEYIIVDFIGIGPIQIMRKIFANIELAYAMTVHKMQGSEAEHVIFGIDFSHGYSLSRELLYTGITRAKGDCHLIAETGALRSATNKEEVSHKQTFLQELLLELSNPKLVF